MADVLGTCLDIKLVYSAHPFLAHLDAIGGIKGFSGGRNIVQELEWPAWQPPFSCMGGTTGESFIAAEFEIRQVAGTKDILPQEFAKEISGSAFGLRSVLNPRPCNYIGGIDQERWPFWRPLMLRRSPGISVISAFSVIYKKLSYERQHPDFILANKEDYEAVANLLPPSDRFPDAREYEDAVIVCDDYAMPDVYGDMIQPPPTLFINSKYIYLRYHRDRQFHKLDMSRMKEAGDRDVFGWAGAMTMSCAYVHGILWS